VRTAVLGERLAATGWFNAEYLKNLVDGHQSGARDNSTPLWTLLMFEAFLRQVVDKHDSVLAPTIPVREAESLS
jgi:asparagine synthase (glutamine-hydrolysing)